MDPELKKFLAGSGIIHFGSTTLVESVYGSKSNLEHFEAIEDENKRLAISGASTLKQRPFLITRYLASPVRQDQIPHKRKAGLSGQPDIL